MPSAKSQKLAELGEPDVLCAVCRRPMRIHYSKKTNKKGEPKLLKKYEGHHATGGYSMRPYRNKTGAKKKSAASRKKAPSSLFLQIMREKLEQDG